MFGSVLAVLASLALYTLWGRVSAQMAHIAGERAHIAGNADSARSGAGGGQAQRRLLIKHLLQKPAIEQAQTHTWGQIETWAKHHPTKPVHDGMVSILETNPSHYKALVTRKVVEDLTAVQKCDSSNVCGSNPIAAFIRSRACPSDRPCPADVTVEIDRFAKWAAKIAVDGAFQVGRWPNKTVEPRPKSPWIAHSRSFMTLICMPWALHHVPQTPDPEP